DDLVVLLLAVEVLSDLVDALAVDRGHRVPPLDFDLRRGEPGREDPSGARRQKRPSVTHRFPPSIVGRRAGRPTALCLFRSQIAGWRRVCEAFVTRSPDAGGARRSPFRGESESAVGRPPTPQIDNRTRSLEPPVQKNEIQNLAFHEQFLDSRPPLAVGG